MKRLTRRLTIAALALAMLGAAPPEPPVVEPAVVLQRYADALASLARPARMIFEFSVEQVGLNNLEETHRVYRAGLRERDETLSTDGVAVKTPAIRILPNSAYKYDVLTLAPKPADYKFVYSGRRRVAGRMVYEFMTASVNAGPFAVTNVSIDAVHFLPVAIGFKSNASNASGTGKVTFAQSGRYWMAREATISAKVGAKNARERIVWSQYRFPASLPASTFVAPQPAPSETPL
jgi:hypothetical protein